MKQTTTARGQEQVAFESFRKVKLLMRVRRLQACSRSSSSSSPPLIHDVRTLDSDSRFDASFSHDIDKHLRTHRNIIQSRTR